MLVKTLGYPIHIINNNLAKEVDNYLKAGHYTSCFILVDENTEKHCLPFFKGIDAEVIVIESGEKNKNLTNCEYIWNKLAKLGADRQSVLINLGGGVIGDMGGFCAAAYMRGISFIQVPTTLLAMVDASIGGKVGIDLGQLKNYVGAFANPVGVFIHPEFLKTLPKREYKAALAEVLKHGLVADESYCKQFMKELEKEEDITHNAGLIADSIAIKTNIVRADPQEQGERKKLNYGHTVGHAVESYYLGRGKNILHGEAVAIGLFCETFLSVKLNGLDEQVLTDVRKCLKQYFPKLSVNAENIHPISLLTLKDKKNKQGLINLTLLKACGIAEINKTCTLEAIEESLYYYHNNY